MKEFILYMVVTMGGHTWIDGQIDDIDSMSDCVELSEIFASAENEVIDSGDYDSVTYVCQQDGVDKLRGQSCSIHD